MKPSTPMHKVFATLVLVCALAIFAASNLQVSRIFAQGTAFTYQGRLNDGGSPANGDYDLRFTLYDAAANPGSIVAGPMTNSATAISNGLFTVALDFGDSPFAAGAPRWLEIGVRTNGSAAFTTLSSRQALTAAPYAITASNLTGTVSANQLTGALQAGQLAGTYSGQVNFSNPADTFSGNGTALSNVNAVALGGVTAAGFWQLGGNTVAPGQFIGSTNSQSLELRVGNQRVLRLEPDASGAGAPNVIGGAAGNFVGTNSSGNRSFGVTIAGGGALTPGYSNSVTGDFGTVGGGAQNTSGFDSTVAGGFQNTAGPVATVGGGQNNIASGAFATVAGGTGNNAGDQGAAIAGGDNNYAGFLGAVAGGDQNRASGYAFVGGGYNNQASGPYYGSAFVGAGQNNNASGDFAAIPGGDDNIASGTNSFAAGHLAQVASDFSSVGGGQNNRIQNGANSSVIAGGANNLVQGGALASVISGGALNTIQSNAVWSTIAGGNMNTQQIGASWSFIGGGSGNTIQNNANQAAISGGQFNTIGAGSSFASLGGGYSNTISNNNTAVSIAGGYQNTVQHDSYEAVIAGGWTNTIGAQDYQSFIGGGNYNSIQGGSSAAALVGGSANSIQSNASGAFIGGGWQNTNAGVGAVICGGQLNSVGTNGDYGAVGGGFLNMVSGNSATVPGGVLNVAAGMGSFAAGQNAKATNDGAFVWADSQNADFGSTTSNQFNVRASGGVRLETSGAGLTLDGQPMLTIGSSSLGFSLQENSAGAPNVLEGSPWNSVGAGVVGATIGGGGATNYFGNRYTNSVTADFGTIGGGAANIVQAQYAVIAGGSLNTNAANNSFIGGGVGNLIMGYGSGTIGGGTVNTIMTAAFGYGTIAGGAANLLLPPTQASVIGGGEFNTNAAVIATIGGGEFNSIQTNAGASTISGGHNNVIGTNSPDATIAGGDFNSILSSAGHAVIGGGLDNTNGGQFSVIAGGTSNYVAGDYSLAAGQRAKAIDDGTFVWADSQSADFASTTTNEFSVRAQNGVRLQSDTGVHLNAADRPLIVRDWDPFNSTAGNGKANIGRWGLFMEPGLLTLGIPNSAGRFFQVARYNTDGTSVQLMQVDQNGSVSSGGLRLNDKPAYLRAGADVNHGLAYCGVGATNFAPSVLPDGPVLWGFSGGALGAMNGGAHSLLTWNSVSVNISSSAESQTSPPALSISGNRQGGFGNPLVQIQNVYPPNILVASPALRVINSGNSPDGALSVTTLGTGLIARFGNASSFVADITTNGAIDALVFNTTSDWNAKENFAAVNSQQVLQQVAALPLSQWNYKQDKSTRHIGPMAQDFQAAFNVGADDKHIATVDADGVALAAIQGLNQKVEDRAAELERQLRTKEARIEQLEARLEKLEAFLVEKK